MRGANGARPGQAKLNPTDGQQYVWIPPGKFTMGCSPGDNECNDNAAMVRTRTWVVLAETVTPVSTLSGRTHWLLPVFGMCRRMNPQSVFVDVGAVLNQLRLAWRWRWRWRVSMDCARCNQSQRKHDPRENFHADSPCLNQRLTRPNLLQCAIRRASNLCLYSPGADPNSPALCSTGDSIDRAAL
jgi:hypothetical protein